MSNFKKILFSWAILSITMSLASCGSDDNDGPDSEGSNSGTEISEENLIGMWRYDWGDDPKTDYTAYYFAGEDEYGDCSGVSFDKGNGGERFEYIFNKDKQTVEIKYDEWSHETLKISDIKSNSIVIDGDRYVKSKLTNEMILLGEWLLHIDVRNIPNGRLSRVIFYSDGTYAAVDDIEDDNYQELNCSFNATILNGRKVYGRYYIDDNEITFTGNSIIAGEYIIDGLVINGMRLIRTSNPNEYPYIIGGWNDR